MGQCQGSSWPGRPACAGAQGSASVRGQTLSPEDPGSQAPPQAPQWDSVPGLESRPQAHSQVHMHTHTGTHLYTDAHTGSNTSVEEKNAHFLV